jgi:RimJ/RimL family protein N-acetyltransferase
MSLFEGKLVRLTQISRENLPVYKRWFRVYETQRLLGQLPVPVTDEFEEDWYDAMSRRTGRGEVYSFSIRTLADDELIGNCSLFDVNHKNRRAELGIVIGEKEYWGRGYGTDAMSVLLRFGFDELNLHRVELQVYDFNPRGIRAYEKLGFVHEGRRREVVWREGAYHDMLLMSILEDEWRKR